MSVVPKTEQDIKAIAKMDRIQELEAYLTKAQEVVRGVIEEMRKPDIVTAKYVVERRDIVDKLITRLDCCL